MRRLIVNADDFGRTPGINEGVIEAHARGVVTSATLMVGYSSVAAAARLAAAHPRLGVGLHVTLTGGDPPLAPPETVPSLVDGRGRLPRDPSGLGAVRAADVTREVRAQLARFRALLGRAPTHLDSHHHSHRRSPVAEAVIAVARDARLPVRCASPALETALESASVATSDHFEERFFGDRVEVDDLLALVRDLPAGTTELMCHPARVDDLLRRSSTYAAPRAVELATLCDARVRRALDDAGVALVHFGALG